MSVKSLQFTQHLNIDIQTAWKFFSNPSNLSKITPAEMNFVIHSDFHSPNTYAGQMICYTVSPLFNLPMEWVTEITHVQAPFLFVDEQRKGPYKLWHHQHHFKETENGVLMTDILHYEVPFGPLGNLMNIFFVEKKIREIFSFRNKVLESLYN